MEIEVGAEIGRSGNGNGRENGNWKKSKWKLKRVWKLEKVEIKFW